MKNNPALDNFVFSQNNQAVTPLKITPLTLAALRYKKAQESSTNTSQLLANAKNPGEAIGYGIAAVIEARRAKREYDALAESFAAQQEQDRQTKESLVATYPEDKRTLASGLPLELLQEKAAENIAYRKPEIRDTTQGVVSIDPSTGVASPISMNGKALMPYRKPDTVVNVNNQQETQYQKQTGEDLAKMDVKYLQDISDKGSAAQQKLSYLDVLDKSLDQIGKTGKLTEFGAAIGNAANQLGIEVDKNKLANVANFQAESNRIILPDVKSLGFNPSNTDREFLVKIAPNIGETFEANKLKIGFARRIAQREQEVGQYADDLRSNGFSPFEIKKAIKQNFGQNNPVFKEEDFKQAESIGKSAPQKPSRDEVIRKLKERGLYGN